VTICRTGLAPAFGTIVNDDDGDASRPEGAGPGFVSPVALSCDGLASLHRRLSL